MEKWGEDGFKKIPEDPPSSGGKSSDDLKERATIAYEDAARRNVNTIKSYVKAYKEVKRILDEKEKLDIEDVNTLLRFFKQDRSLEQLKRPKGMKEDDYVVNLVKPCINAIGEGFPNEEQLKNCFDIGQTATKNTSTTYRQIEAPLEKSQMNPKEPPVEETKVEKGLEEASLTEISIYQKIWDELNSDKVKGLWNNPLLTSGVSKTNEKMVQRCRQFFNIINGNSPYRLESSDFDLVKLLNDRLEPKNQFQYSRDRNPPSIYKGLDDFNHSRSRYLKAFEETEAQLKDLIPKFDPIPTAAREKEEKQDKLKNSLGSLYTSFVSTEDKSKQRAKLQDNTVKLPTRIQTALENIKLVKSRLNDMHNRDMNIESFNTAARIFTGTGQKRGIDFDLECAGKKLSEKSTKSTQEIITHLDDCDQILGRLEKSLTKLVQAQIMKEYPQELIYLQNINEFLSKEISDARKEFAKGKFKAFTSRLLKLLQDENANKVEIKQMLKQIGEINKLITHNGKNDENVISAIIRAGSISQITQISKFLNPKEHPVEETESHLQKLESIKDHLITSPHNTDHRLHTMHEALDDVHSAVERAEKATSTALRSIKKIRLIK